MTSMTCGEATIRLLQRYGVTTVFGIPGVHTLDFCRGLNDSIRHVQARNEQGAGFMAEGWARATGQPGVALVISGPGVTNASTAVGQAYADSLPLLLLSAEPASYTIGNRVLRHRPSGSGRSRVDGARIHRVRQPAASASAHLDSHRRAGRTGRARVATGHAAGAAATRNRGNRGRGGVAERRPVAIC